MDITLATSRRLDHITVDTRLRLVFVWRSSQVSIHSLSLSSYIRLQRLADSGRVHVSRFVRAFVLRRWYWYGPIEETPISYRVDERW
jgi:hypothetical protein